ncbi:MULTISPECIES: hypothetical protein [unclassified Pseudomonas]|uniref:hypothetical protein n=1 Tax=unclassified Pseudomonas TaxID=196821 RepID=UPI000CD0F852|nr:MULTISPECIES: hypothetical protein [unclassified Pseudomonas]POA26314.1 hypothetical protein C1895_05810 [Pseudomonas sp. FW305-3-2-15-E-TSA4]POA44572.1 hypothetical protein C1894_04390 [Pseudomonas sp. FW305-3-2-15-E-TSA2]
MKIILSPQRRDDTLTLERAGTVLTINGEDFDFSSMNDGDTLPKGAIDCEWFAGDIEKVDGDLVVTLFLPNPVNYSQEQAFPVPLVNIPDGPVLLPQPLPEPLVPVTLDQVGEEPQA